MNLLRSSVRLRRLAIGIGITIGAAFTIAMAGVVLTSQGGPLLMAVDVSSASERQDKQISTGAMIAIAPPLARDENSIVPVGSDDEPDNAPPATPLDESQADEEIRWHDGRPIRPARTMTMVVTAYSPDEQSCGKWADGITASGYSVWTNGMNLVAADTSILPFGTLISVPGYDNGNVVPVLDRGGAIRGKRLDVLYPTHERAMQWGVQELEVTVWEFADGKPSGFRSRYP